MQYTPAAKALPGAVLGPKLDFRLTLTAAPLQFFRQPCPPPVPMDSPCKHPRVRIVSRQEDAEFVECELCGEVFDSEEFRDMMIEEKHLGDPAAEEDPAKPD